MFENWYAGGSLEEEKTRMFEQGESGYKLMQTREAFYSFRAGVQAIEDRIREELQWD